MNVSRDLMSLAPVDAVRQHGVRARAHHNGIGHVVLRAIVRGQEKARWYMCTDDAIVVADALEDAGRTSEATELRTAIEQAILVPSAPG